jgi:DNA-binding ferritin-like protein
MSAEDVNFFFTLREQIKLYHWQTHVFARHKATDDVIAALDTTIDEYVETYMGKYGRPRMTARTNTVRVQNITEKTVTRFIKAAIAHLQGPLVKKLKPTDTDLVNLRDEMLGELNKILYLFTLK